MEFVYVVLGALAATGVVFIVQSVSDARRVRSEERITTRELLAFFVSLRTGRSVLPPESSTDGDSSAERPRGKHHR